jgi:hypothetical protein
VAIGNNGNIVTTGTITGYGAGITNTNCVFAYVTTNENTTTPSAVQPITLQTLVPAAGSSWTLSGSANLTTSLAGYYLVNYRAECTNSSAATFPIEVIASNVTQTLEIQGSEFTAQLQGKGGNPFTVSFIVHLAANDQLQFAYAAANTSMYLASAALPPFTTAPPTFSVTITRISP